ncbi:MAG: DUF1501 domain-containing protein [Myxococcota bacterium]
MHTSRRRFLAAAAAGLALPSMSARAASPRRLVVLFAEGGWDVSFCMDPKFSSDQVDGPDFDEDPGNPDDREALQTFGTGGGIPIAVNDFKRPAVSGYFSRWADRTAVVNGVWMGAIAHATARVRILTGTQNQANPSFAAITGHELGEALPLGSIDLSGGSYSGYLSASTGQVGYQSQIKALMIDDAAFPAPAGADYTLPLYQADDADRALLSARLSRRVTEVRPRWDDAGKNRAMLDGRAEALIRASRFRAEGASTIEKLRLGAAASLIEQADLAVDFLGGDLCRAVTLDSRRYWDTHDNNALQHDNFQALFEGIDHLVTRLDETGLLNDTLVVVVSEFTRTPTLNSGQGKDHWPHGSVLLAGGNVRGGRTYGGTDDRLESRKIDLQTGEVDDGGHLNKYDNLASGILHALDIDPGPWYPTISPFVAPFG